MLEVISCPLGNALDKAKSNPIGKTDEHDRAKDSQQNVVGPFDVIG
ncbi:hypothetical protein [Synechococcus sp. A15-28]|nr:hypothetical protein [Synechococcus sp. A15-28]